MGNKKRATCLATSLQNELNSDVARFTTHDQTGLATNLVNAGCETLLQEEESSLLFATKSVSPCCAFYRLKANLFFRKCCNPRVCRDFRVILSNQKSYSCVLQQL